MKKTILATLALGAAMLTSCSYDTYQTGPPSHRHPGGGGSWGGPGPGRPGSGQNQHSAQAYQRGHNDGARDKRTNRRFDPSRGQNSVNARFRDSYRQGYTAGYRNASDRNHGGNWGNRSDNHRRDDNRSRDRRR